ncbi:MAG: hypothetical protein ACI398_08915 [Clostridium sp.]
MDSRNTYVETKLISVKDNTYKIKSTGAYIRFEMKPNEENLLNWVDFDGGPMLKIGDIVSGREIEKIAKDSNDIFITFK